MFADEHLGGVCIARKERLVVVQGYAVSRRNRLCTVCLGMDGAAVDRHEVIYVDGIPPFAGILDVQRAALDGEIADDENCRAGLTLRAQGKVPVQRQIALVY